MHRAFLPVLILAPAFGGCIVGTVAKTAVDVVAVPVKVVGKGIDAALPNQKRADEKRGRELRKEDERRARHAPGVLLEASGGVRLGDVAALAAAGVDRISVGALTHSAGALDIALDFDAAGSS